MSTTDSPEEPSPARGGRHRRTADQPGPEPSSEPTRAGRHRRPRRPRLTAEQAGELLRLTRSIHWAVEEVRKHEAPIRECFHHLMEAAQPIVDAITSLLG